MTKTMREHCAGSFFWAVNERRGDSTAIYLHVRLNISIWEATERAFSDALMEGSEKTQLTGPDDQFSKTRGAKEMKPSSAIHAYESVYQIRYKDSADSVCNEAVKSWRKRVFRPEYLSMAGVLRGVARGWRVPASESERLHTWSMLKLGSWITKN